ncbi:phosphatase PAP2 family protein [Sphingomonas sp. PB4P5]|uniref:phosphatase PAP2 family protein n=1 Tax=Parasphingomonas puruogangriensis TaxID=3096155 RepID=UPI002FCC43BA
MSQPPGASSFAPVAPVAHAAAEPQIVIDVPLTPSDNSGVPLGWMLGGLLATFVALALTMHRAGLAIDPWSTSNLPFYVFGLSAIAARAWLPGSGLRYARSIADGAEYYGLFIAMTLMGAISCYPVVALTHGYSDAKLQAVDAWLGFDWLAWYRTVAASPLLQRLGTIAYRSIYLSPALLLGYYALAAQRAEAHRFIITFWICAIFTLVTFRFMPAVGPFSHLWHAPIPYMPESELWQPDLIPQLRAHRVHIIDLGQLRGLVSAPSFHAAAATLYAATAWRVARLRWPLLVVNAAMLLATPVEGTHYLADILLGIVVAGVTLAVVHQALRWSGCPRPAGQ